jgi:AcrR family transcriptional regulator
MDATHAEDPPRPGLRERKKAKTRALIQEHAMRLFRERGYAATSIEAIAEAAELSSTTIVRYYPDKSDLVLYDDWDERLAEAIRAQPAELGAVQVARNALRSVFDGLADHEVEARRERERLMWQEPELRGAMLLELIRTERDMANLVAERSGLPTDDARVLAVAGAVIGVSMAAWFACEGDASLARYVELFESALTYLEAALPL